MFCKVYCACCNGIDAITVTVEVDITPGISFNLVGLPDVAVKESLQRISGALGHFGFKIPGKRILVNMAPANIKKEGSAFDLAIAVGILYASGQIIKKGDGTELYIERKLSGHLIMGELALDGTLRLCESVPSMGSVLSEFVSDAQTRHLLSLAEQTLYHSRSNAMTNWGLDDVNTFFSTRFRHVAVETLESREERTLDRNTLTMWITKSYMGVLDAMDRHSDTLLDKVLHELEGRKVPWRHSLVFVSATNSDRPRPRASTADKGAWKDVLDMTRGK